jgi:peptide/nickel transport system permease protein
MTLLVVILAMFFLASLIYFIPGDPVKTILGPRANETLSNRVRQEMGLDKPIPVQLAQYFINTLHGDLGRDFINGKPVWDIIKADLPHTIWLAIVSLAMGVIIGVPLGAYSAAYPNTWIDRITGFTSITFITISPYVAGLFLLLLFSVELKVLPAMGAGNINDPRDYFIHLILPSVALSITWVGYIARLVRTSMLEILNENYIRTVKAFGLPRWKVFYKYALKNSIIPTIAILGVGLGNELSGSIFVEVIFSRPGLGRLIYEAILDRNYPIVRGGVLVAAVLFVLANLIADLSYHMVDPRIETQESHS